MDETSPVKRYIYFPPSYVPHYAPRVIYVTENWGDKLKGNGDYPDLMDGRFQFYPIRRCQIYSERLWEECQKWVEERDQLEEKFTCLMRRGVYSQPVGADMDNQPVLYQKLVSD